MILLSDHVCFLRCDLCPLCSCLPNKKLYTAYEAILRFVARLAFVAKNIRAVELASMSFEELMGDDEHVLAYWKRVSGGVE